MRCSLWLESHIEPPTGEVQLGQCPSGELGEEALETHPGQKWEACSRSESLIWRWELGGKGVCVTPASLESCVCPVENKRATHKANLKGTQISVSKYRPH